MLLKEAERRIRQTFRSQFKELSLAELGLTELPESIGRLIWLEKLYLSNNRLSRLPEWIGRLDNLQWLYLNGNQLSTLPEWIGRLDRLQWLRLGGNRLSGLPETIGGLAGLQRLDFRNNQLSALPETIGGLAGLQELNLSNNQLSGLPETIGRLAGLQNLDLRNNHLSGVPETIGGLSGLQTLNLWNNQLRGLPKSIGGLAGLQTLDLGDNQLSGLPESIGGLAGLQTLVLSDNQLSGLPETIGRLAGLQSLDLRNNQLSGVPESIGGLAGLQRLDLRNNQLSALPETIGGLAGLQELCLSNNQLSGLPETIGRLAGLQSLDLRNNHLSGVPETIGGLAGLQTLNLWNNQLRGLPKSIGGLAGLQTLDLGDNQLSGLPKMIGRLENLVRLNVENNRLKTLPESLGKSEGLIELTLHGNPALGLPDEALGPTYAESGKSNPPKPPKEILDYYFSTRGEGGEALRELRLIVVGRPKSGKTSLIKRLLGKPMDPAEPETHGIDIRPLDLQCPDGTLHARIWDFGGQHVLHAMHEFFLRRRCLYLLVVEQRVNDVERELTYWLQLIRSYAGEAPVVVALNQSRGIARSLARGALERDYGPILAWVPTECDTEENVPGSDATIEALRAALTAAAADMPEPKKLFPRKWLAIKRWLEGMQAPYLDYAIYQERCAALHEEDPEQQAALAAAMDELGVALNYARDPRLRDTTVLRPNWLANGIYALLRANILTPAPLAPDGVLTEKKVGEILAVAGEAKVLKADEYPRGKWEFLLRLMNLFQLSFPLDEEGKRYLAPALLPADEPPDTEEPEGPERVQLRYEFDVVPGALMGRLLVRLFPLIDGGKRWQRGARLRYGGARARVWADLSETYVYATVAGEGRDSAELLEIIREALKQLFREYERLRVVEQRRHREEWVPRRTLEQIGALQPEGDEEEASPGEGETAPCP